MFHVKHSQTQADDERAILQEACEQYGLPPLSEPQVDALLSHLDLVLEHNKVTNLTAIRDRASALRLHVVDSLGALPALAAAPEGRVCDLGSGPGYPGVPIAIVSGRATTLVESNGKKCRFLQNALAGLCLDGAAQVSHARIEEFGSSHSGQYAVVVARALSSLPSLVELASPCLAVGGWFIALKASPADAEMRAGDEVARMCGLERTTVLEYVLPGGTERRMLVTYVRTRPSSIRLPRPMGKAQNSPLA